MLYLTCRIIPNVELAQCWVSRAKYLGIWDCATNFNCKNVQFCNTKICQYVQAAKKINIESSTGVGDSWWWCIV